MKLAIYQIDAFTGSVFSGNPAAVCPLETWLDEDLMQSIAAENNLSETAFFVKRDDLYELRWFTPLTEIDLCGHATLAAAFVIINEIEHKANNITFSTKSGRLFVQPQGNRFRMDFPAQPPSECDVPERLIQGLGKKPLQILAAGDFLAVYASEQDIADLNPNFEHLKRLPRIGVITTAPASEADFVSRWFGPNVGINEDPVTGAAHCTLTPYWAKRLGKKRLYARQISARGGELHCELNGQNVILEGTAVKYMEGMISI